MSLKTGLSRFRIVAGAAVLAAVALGGALAWQRLSDVRLERRRALVASQLVRCRELVTIKNSYSSVVAVKKSRASGLAKSYSIVKFSGEIRAGIPDIAGAEFVLFPGGVRVRLPACEILGNDITGIEVFDEQKSVFVAVSMQEILDEIDAEREAAEEAQVARGILDDARAQARAAVLGMLQSAGLGAVTVE